MKKRIMFVTLIIVLCLIFVGSAVAASSDNYRIDWVIPMTGGGGGTSSSANYTASFTVGQSAVGTTESGNYQACTGFWCDLFGFFKIYLPLILK